MRFCSRDVVKLLLLLIEVLIISGSNYNETYCAKKVCVNTASQMHVFLDETRNPCKNFYEYACGSFVQKKVVHDRNGEEGFNTILQEKEDEKFRRILSSPIHESDIKAFRMIKSVYEMCQDHDRLDELGLKPVFDLLTKFGGWELLGRTQNKESMHWQDLYESMNREGFSLDYFLSIYLTIDPRNSSVYVIKMVPPEKENFNRAYYDLLPLGLNNSIIRTYHTYMKEFTIVLGASDELAEKEMLKVLQFEQELFKIKESSKQKVDDEFVTIAELQQKYPSIQWDRFVNTLTSGVYRNTSGEQKILIAKPKYFELLNSLIDATSKRIIKNYLFWRVVDFSVYFLPINYKKPALKFFDFVHGSLQIEQRWKRCVSHIKMLFPIGTASMLARTKQSDNVVEPKKIIQAVKNQTVEYVLKLKLEPKDKQMITDKMENLRLSVGYPDEYFSDEAMNDFYKDMEIFDGQYYKSALGARQLRNRRYRERILAPVKSTGWQSYDDGQSFYSSTKNTIFITTSYLKSPFYDVSLPNYINYAGLGFHVASLFGVALVFELKPLNFSDYESLENTLKLEYETYVQKNFNFPIDGTNAGHINMADLFGYFLAYHALKNENIQAQTESLRLPGMHFNPEQFFWLYSAQKFCQAIKAQEAFQRAKLSSFPIESFRVNGPLKSNKSFQRDFNCQH